MSRRAATRDLGQVIRPNAVVHAWKNSIRTGLRDQPIPDLHDYLDIHRNIKGIASRISADVIAGRYRTSPPEFVTVEKKDGIARRTAVPDPSDALVLQCIVDTLEKHLKAAQPTSRAYYSRSHMPHGVERVDGTFAYPWWQMWPDFQQRIYTFATTHPFVVITDIANYFDTIPLHALRNTIASLSQLSEHVLNLLFFVLEAMAWRPNYNPHSGVGLPTLNFDAPRLLAHAYLFKVDEELNHLTQGDFVRWMDDIDAGVQSRETGKILLRRLQEVANCQGLQLNTSKTRVLSAKEAFEHFNISHNRALTILANTFTAAVNPSASIATHRAVLRRSYRKFRKTKRVGHWDKVQKRYLGLFGRLNDSHAVKHVAEFLASHPSMRAACFGYLRRLGYSAGRLKIVVDFAYSGNCEDDASILAVAECLVDWDLPTTPSLRADLLKLAEFLAQKQAENPAFAVGAGLWLNAKYAEPDELFAFLTKHRSAWEHSGWGSRQAAAVIPRLTYNDRLVIIEALRAGGLLQGLQVLASLNAISNLTVLDPQLSAYLHHVPAVGFPYALSKIVLAITILNSKQLDPPSKQATRTHLAANVKDARYRQLLGLPP